MPNRFIDAAIVYRILRMLVTPFDKTDAYRLGIIDAKGKILKKENQLTTTEQRNAYTLLHRLVFRLKRIIEKVPIENKKFVSFAAALALIRENYEKGLEPIDLERRFLDEMTREHDTMLVEQFFNNKYTMTFKQFTEEDGGGMAPANNAAVTGGIAGLPPDQPPVPAMNKLNMFRRKKKNELVAKIK
jgi:hypothetical protein